MDKFNYAKAQLEKYLEEDNQVTRLLKQVESKTGISKLNLVYGLFAFVGLWLMIGFGSHILCNFIGFLYPAYASLKAIESKATDDDTKWLTYWVVYAAFGMVEVFTDILLFWIPLYSLLKCVFLLFLMAPIDNNGSVLLYNKVIKPFVLQHQAKIDATLNRAKDLAGDIQDKVKPN